MVDGGLLARITLSCAALPLWLNMLPKGTHLSVDTCVNLWKVSMVCMGPKNSRLMLHRGNGYAYTRTPTPQNNVDYPSFVWQTTDGASSREIITCNLSVWLIRLGG